MRSTAFLLLAARALSFASITTSLPSTAVTMALNKAGELNRVKNYEQVRVQRHQERRTQTVEEGETAAKDQEAPENATTTAADDVPENATTTTATGVAEVSAITTAAANISTDSPGEIQQPITAATDISDSSIYNTRMKPCLGYETEGLIGYTTLDDLRYDLQLYFYDMNGYSYHRTAGGDNDVMATKSPLSSSVPLSPTLSPKPSVTGGSSNAPNTTGQQPVSGPATEEPTSSLFLKRFPTKSPSPTIVIQFAGVTGASPVNATSMDNVVVSIPDGALDGGSAGNGGDTTSQMIIIGGNDDPATVLGSSVSIAPIPIPHLRTASPSKSPSLSPMVLDENQVLLSDGNGRKRIRGGHDGSGGRRRLQEVDEMTEESVVEDAMNTTTTQATSTSSITTTVPPKEELVEMMNADGQAELDEAFTTNQNNNEEGEVFVPVTAAEATTTSDTPQEQQQLQGEMQFRICPNSTFQFNNMYVDQLKYTPLVFESPVQQSVTLACLKDNQCTFSDGDYHIVFNNNGLEDDNLDQSSMDQRHGTITVSGINFQQAEQASIVMNDPRGKIIFDKCKWENNNGVAIVVDGKYSSKNLEVEYYGADEFMLPPGKVDPWESTEPTVPAATTAVNFDFLFGGTTEGSVTTEMMIGVQTSELPDVFSGGENDFDGFDGQRSLQETSAAGGGPKSLIVIRNSTFTGNKGETTIAVDSFTEGQESDSSSSANIIYLELEGSKFSSESVQKSVIVTSGAHIKSIGSVFEKNTASSMIETSLGFISITDTQFIDNVITGGEGVVVIDVDTKVGDNNCVQAPAQSEGGLNATLPTPIICEGTVVMMGGTCLPFGICEMNETEAVSDCHDNWADLKSAVENKIVDGLAVLTRNGTLDFKICPNNELDASTGPIVIDYEDITVQCGSNGLKSDNCLIVGGFVHFHIIGSSTGVKLAGLKMTSSTGSSVVAAGMKDATLQITDCEWNSNTGASAVLIRNNATFDASTGTFDILSMLDSSAAAMSVEMSGVGFMQNVLTYGTVANVNGSLYIDTGRFNDNEVKVADIAVLNSGGLAIHDSCFDKSASIFPGTIFIDEISHLWENTDNFGWDNTDGGYLGGLTCTDIFIEAVGSDCSTGSNCNGTCIAFPSKTCPLDVTSLANTSEANSPPYIRSPNASNTTSIVPIIVAVLVCFFVVFGLGFIIFKRRRKTPTSEGSYQEVDIF